MKIERVLVVDDDEDIRAVTELSIRRIGHWDVLLAASGEEALVLARDQHPDVILLDTMMPVLDGPSTLAKLRAEPATAGIPVIFLTAQARPRDVEGYLALGAAGVIGKPFDATTLPGEIRRIVEAS